MEIFYGMIMGYIGIINYGMYWDGFGYLGHRLKMEGLMGTLSIHGGFSIAMFDDRRAYPRRSYTVILPGYCEY